MAGIMPLTRPVTMKSPSPRRRGSGSDDEANVGSLGVLSHGAVERNAADKNRDEVRHGNSSDAANARNGESFSEELDEDVALARAESFFDPDFAGALLHGNQHDVHEADACDAQRECAEQGEQSLKRDGQNLELVELRAQGEGLAASWSVVRKW